jgi:hypothetical protein
MSLPILHPTAARRPDPEQEPLMTRNPRRRIALLLVAACVLVALTAGVAIGASGRGGDHTTAATEDSFRVTAPAGWPAPWVPTVSWNGNDDVISVSGTKCPRSHPKKVGSSSSSSSTQVDGGPVRRHSRHRTICAR